MKADKCVLVVDHTLPLGVLANTTAVLAASIGKLKPEIVGVDLLNADGLSHRGITTKALPILKAHSDLLGEMRRKLREYEPELIVVDIISATRSTRSYEEYAKVMKDTPTSELQYFGLAMYGEKKLVIKLTGNLALLR